MAYSLKSLLQQVDILEENLSLPVELIQGSSPTSGRIHGLIEARRAIMAIESYGILKEDIAKLRGSIIFMSSRNEARLVWEEARNLDSYLKEFRAKLRDLASVIRPFVPIENESSFNFKFPEVQNFDDLSKYSKEIHIALSQILHDEEIGGQTTISSVTNGSIWVNIFVGTPAALTLIASLAWSATVIFKKRQEGRFLQEQVRAYKLKNDSLQQLVNAQKEELDLLVIAESEQILTKHFKNHPNETLERIRNSVKMVADLIERGAEFKPSLIAPEEVGNLFPNTKEIFGVGSPPKSITEGTGN